LELLEEDNENVQVYDHNLLGKFIQQHEIAMHLARDECDKMVTKYPDSRKVIDTNNASISIWHKLTCKIEEHYKHNIINVNDKQKLLD
jgi:hypothetical protein